MHPPLSLSFRLAAHIFTLNPIIAGGGGDADSVRAGADARRVRRQGQGGRPQEDQGRARLLSEQVLKIPLSCVHQMVCSTTRKADNKSCIRVTI